MHRNLKHAATPSFWAHYRALPVEIRNVADKNYALLSRDPRHPSLQLKRVGRNWSVRVGLDYRALAAQTVDGTLVWWWIGPHDEYERLISRG